MAKQCSMDCDKPSIMGVSDDDQTLEVQEETSAMKEVAIWLYLCTPRL